MIYRKKNKVLVIGDIILDQYYNGTVSRTSPEAPVPVIKMQHSTKKLGGAANVANNLTALGCKTALIGTIGIDEAGEEIIRLLEERNIETASLNRCSEFKTNTKVRIIGNRQQIVRLDYNDEEKPQEKDFDKMIDQFKNIIAEYDVVVLSDYNKGLCSIRLCEEVLHICNKENKIVIVDPKGSDWSKYHGASIITPNLKEISEYMGLSIENLNEEIEKKCSILYNEIQIPYLLITRSEKGMTLVDQKNHYTHFPTKAKEVFDVSGAGDTVVAALAAFMDSSEDLISAVHLANIAAGIVVGKSGTAVATLREIETELRMERKGYVSNKIMNMEELLHKVKEWRENGEVIVFTNGCYDIFHKGHVFSIYSAAEFGDHLIVAVNSDASVRKLKGFDRPINHQEDRAYVIAALGCVDAVVIFHEDTPLNILSEIRPDVLVKGGDYQADEVIGREFAGRVELIDYIKGYSTTNLIHKIYDK